MNTRQTNGTNGKWDDHWVSQESSLEERVSYARRRLINKLKKYISPGIDVLDAGCGSGLLSKYLAESGCNVYSLDYSQKALSVCRKITKGKCCKYLNNDLYVSFR